MIFEIILIDDCSKDNTLQVLKNILALTVAKGRGGKIDAYEVGLKTLEDGVILPCGNSGIWING